MCKKERNRYCRTQVLNAVVGLDDDVPGDTSVVWQCACAYVHYVLYVFGTHTHLSLAGTYMYLQHYWRQILSRVGHKTCFGP